MTYNPSGFYGLGIGDLILKYQDQDRARDNLMSEQGRASYQAPSQDTFLYPPFQERLAGWLCQDQPAITFMVDLLFIAARWDDLIDRDQILLDQDIHQLMEAALSLCVHPFFQQHASSLYPLLHNSIRNWKVSLTIERDPSSTLTALMNAFILRSSYIDILGQCAMLLKGNAWAERVVLEARLHNSNEGFPLYLKNLDREALVRSWQADMHDAAFSHNGTEMKD